MLKYYTILLTFLVITNSSLVKGQANVKDSLTQLLQTDLPDTTAAKVYVALSREYWYNSFDTALTFANKALELVNNKDTPAYLLQRADALNSKGVILHFKTDYTEALKCLFTCLEIYEKLKMPVPIAMARGNIALIYQAQKDYELAIEQHSEALKIFSKENQRRSMAIAYINLSTLYMEVDKEEQALEMTRLGIQIGKEIKNNEILGIHKTQAGHVLMVMGQFDSAKTYLDDALALVSEGRNNYHIARCYGELGLLADSLNNFQDAINYGVKAYNHGLKSGSKDLLAISTALLAKAYQASGNHEKAYFFLEKKMAYQDTLFNEDKNKELHKLELAQKDAQIALERQQRELQSANNDRKNIIILSITGALLLSVVMAYMFFRGRQREKQDNLLLAAQKKEILQQNEELQQQSEEIATQRDAIEEKSLALHERNEQITQSIKAAQLIQQAMIPYESRVQTYLKEYFTFYKPKDIVSGDFYWINKVGNTVVAAAVDCTGHGVPGAFMSMIGNLLLDEIILVNKITNPAQILSELNQQVIRALHQKDNRDLNGMDVTLVSFELNDSNEVKLNFSGAKRPLYYYDHEQDKVEIVKGTNKAIGGHQNEKVFENQELTLYKGNMIYLGSDGIEDQHNFKNRKIGRTKFVELLEQVACLPAEKQKLEIEDFFTIYKEGVHQRDDVLLLGIRF